MRFVIVTRDPEVQQAASKAFPQSDEVSIFADWEPALDACSDADLLIVDLLATLDEPHKIAGYERFALAKMAHETAKDVPLVLIGAPDDYSLDFMTGWPNFVYAHVRRPVTDKIFRRAATWV
jgi:hypothetical protein